MSLRDQIQADITAAMRGGDALRRDVLRMAVNAAYNLEKRNQKPLGEDECGHNRGGTRQEIRRHRVTPIRKHESSMAAVLGVTPA